MKIIQVLAFWLLVIGGINWGLVAFLDFDLAVYAAKMTKIPSLTKILYALICASGIIAAVDTVRK